MLIFSNHLKQIQVIGDKYLWRSLEIGYLKTIILNLLLYSQPA